jgi:hypothetical protein
LIEKVRLVHLGLGQQEETHDFVIAHDAGSDEGSLSVILGFEVDVDQFVLE